jgi:hypothetical protein
MSKMIFCIQNFLLPFRLTAVIEYDGQLSATAYIILAVMLLGIIMGLGWCFYRAIKAEDKLSEPQKPDEIGN